jgi:hypothetical protein
MPKHPTNDLLSCQIARVYNDINAQLREIGEQVLGILEKVRDRLLWRFRIVLRETH